MSADALFARKRQWPFVPFRLIFRGGVDHRILHPAMLVVTRTGMSVAIYGSSQQTTPDEIPERYALFSPEQVVAVEDLPR